MAAERSSDYRLGWTALTEEKAQEVCVGLNVQTLYSDRVEVRITTMGKSQNHLNHSLILWFFYCGDISY